MEDYSCNQKDDLGQGITSMHDLSIEALNEEAELERVDYETLMEEIRAS